MICADKLLSFVEFHIIGFAVNTLFLERHFWRENFDDWIDLNENKREF